MDNRKKAQTSPVFVMMGVSGSGKTTVGQALAVRLNCPFYDGDDFHPPANVAKMSRGIPLTDADRAPWLARLAAIIQDHLHRQETAVVACSALKKKYRTRLRVNEQVQFIFLDGSFDLIWQRMAARQDHFMKKELLQSQFEALERPATEGAINVYIDQPVEVIVAQICTHIQCQELTR